MQSQFEGLEAGLGRLADRFLLRLFAAHPGARSVMPRELDRPKRRVGQLMSIIAGRLHDFGALEEGLRGAGERYAAKGATGAHYAAARTAMLAALGDALGSAWTPLARGAWSAALEAATGIMMRAGRCARMAA